MPEPTTTISALPNASLPLAGNERVPMDQSSVTVDASTQDIADLATDSIVAFSAAFAIALG